jgi:DNA-binding response OmpR family regulator
VGPFGGWQPETTRRELDVGSLVLIVEDNVMARHALNTLIRRAGHATITAATVREALERLGAGPSHVVLDMNLPDGLGTTVLRRIRAGRLPMKVAVLSACVDRAVMSEAASLLPDAVFAKPINIDVLLNWLVASRGEPQVTPA